MTSTLGIKKIQYPNGTNIATLDSSGSIAFAGASTVAGTLGVTGVLTGTSLDISGNIDVDGTTNLDVVDIDGAVNMASTLIVSGTTTIQKASSGGTANSSAALVIEGTDATKAHIQLLCDNSDVQSIYFGDAADNDIGRIAYDHTGNTMRFNVNAAERMRIDQYGNLFIATTNASPANGNVQGTAIKTNNAQFSANDNNAITANRMTSDGDIVILKKAGTTVGSIGSASSKLHIASTGNSGLRFRDDLNCIIPCNADGSNSDADQNLGQSGVRFQTLFLSGGVRLGGTGAANELDDYEEGTWTPTTNNGTGYSAQFGRYVKIGKMVWLNANINTSTTSGVGNLIQGLPFTSSNTGNSAGNLSIGYYAGVDVAMVWLTGYVLNS